MVHSKYISQLTRCHTVQSSQLKNDPCPSTLPLKLSFAIILILAYPMSGIMEPPRRCNESDEWLCLVPSTHARTGQRIIMRPTNRKRPWGTVTRTQCVSSRADIKSRIRECLDFSPADLWSSLAYESAEQKPNLRLPISSGFKWERIQMLLLPNNIDLLLENDDNPFRIQINNSLSKC